MALPPQPRFHLWRVLVAQELTARYRGSLLGRAWPLLLPLLMLALYGFVFGVVFRARWPGLAEGDHLGFTLNLFTGLLVHGLLSDSVGQAPVLMQRYGNFVRKVVFPLQILPAVPLGVGLVNLGLGLAILLVVNGVWGSGLHWSALAVPLVLLPYVAMLQGLSLALAALGVYVRDLGQVIGALVMVTLFTSTVFFPRERVPQALAGVVDWNPISWPVEALRGALLHGQWPGMGGVLAYSAAAALVLALGGLCFRALRRGFADVL
ncbi:ABC transporter permease [Stenotrophomonas sp. PS02297]|uniref:ABC transporter permease n=1 Tax=Stenotrophomonas sp. PS02297 TaxID=2991423 RepID=UPI00249ADAB7|nr:ABC transporter permease [Stenotrophomonas sp. PS02297]